MLYLNPGGILCSKFNYSEVTSTEIELPYIFISLFYWENLQKWKIYSQNTYALNRFEPPSPSTHSYVFVMTPSSPYLRTYLLLFILFLYLLLSLSLLLLFNIVITTNTTLTFIINIIKFINE